MQYYGTVKDNNQQQATMASITPKQHRNKKSNGEPDTPPSAKSANSDTTASSNATVAACITSVAGSWEASETFPVSLRPTEGGEGEEEEEEEEFQQEGLPEEIKNRKYLDNDGNLLEVELVKDIEKFGLEDCDIDLNSDGIAHWRMAPPRMHQEAVGAIDHCITVSQGEENDRLCTDQGFSVLIDLQGVKRDPDLAVWGKDRITTRSSGRLAPISKEVVGLGSWRVNPHVIFEFSWSNDLEKDEIPKFREQMNQHLGELGKINLGFLIKTKSSKGKKYPREKNRGEIPIYGFDIYEARPSDPVEPASPTYKYRVGDKEEVDLIVPGDDLTNGDGSEGDYLDITIPIRVIREEIESIGVKFEKLAETN